MRKWRSKRRRDQKGVTIFEVMIALALFAIIIVPIMRSFLTAMKVNQRSRETMIATDVAQSVMEGISGKSYYQICKSLNMAPGGFDFSTPNARKDSGKYALSSINQGYYNCGNINGSVEKISGFSTSISGISNQGCTYSNPSPSGIALRLDQVMVQPAVTNLTTYKMVGANGCLKPYENVWDTDTPANNVFSGDKRLFYGQSAEKYVGGPLDTLPKISYMLYTRVEKDNQFFDVTVTFIPRAQNVNVKDTSTDKDTFFTYEVTVSVYPYDYDPKTETFINRFDADGYIEGAPAAVMVSGIESYRYQDSDS